MPPYVKLGTTGHWRRKLGISAERYPDLVQELAALLHAPAELGEFLDRLLGIDFDSHGYFFLRFTLGCFVFPAPGRDDPG